MSKTIRILDLLCYFKINEINMEFLSKDFIIHIYYVKNTNLN